MSIHRPIWFLSFCLFCSKSLLIAQCPITVNAGPDILVCDAGNTAMLQGSVNGPYIGFVWSPATGLSDPNILNPTATVTGPATYTLSAQAVDPSASNMVNNPGFESGNSGFTSAYIYNPTPITPGTYVLTTSPALVLSSFPPCDDHTFGNGTGNMMLINGNASTGAQVWCQTIPVLSNTWYVMSGWAMASPITPPVLQFSVNGTPVGDPYPVGSGTCNWQQFSAAWYSGSATTAQLCILDQISGGNGFFGDDYALDDIFFAPACTVTDEVTVDVANIQAVVPVSAFLLCNTGPAGIQLDGSGSSSGPGITYLWTGPGSIGGADTPIATVHEVGYYTLTVTFDNGTTNCQVSSSLTVLDDPNVVTATAAANEILNCTNLTAQLDGTGSSVGNTIDYNWEPASAVVNGQGTLMPEVNQPGLYTLTVTNSISGCTATASAIVTQNTTQPTAMAAAPTPLSCTVFETLLSGVGSSTGNNFSYQWTGPGIVAGDMTLNGCLVNIPGNYTLTVTNNVNGCTATATTLLATNAFPPTASASASGNLSCTNPTANLSSVGSSSGPGISYAWASQNGHFVGATNGPTATVDSASVYVLTVTNASNGCTATASVSVTANFAQPTVGIATPVPMLNCLADSVQLDASQSSNGAGFSFLWASQNGGTFLSGQTTLTPWVSSAGVYTLTLTNTASGCTASASATVTTNTTPPIAQAGPNATLDCSGTAIQLNGGGSSGGSNISYQWTTSGGNIVSGDTTLMPEVDGVGTYFLLVENVTNGCTAIDSVAVGQDANAPTVVIAPAGQLDCDTDEITLNASGSSAGANITLTWSGPGFVNGQNTLMPTVELPGVYSLTLLNQSNNCEATASVTVVQDVTPPIADAGPEPTNGDCFHDIEVIGFGSSQGSQFSYQWSNGGTSLTSLVTVFGTYYMTLTVTNNENGCIAIDSVLVDLPLDPLPAYTVLADTLSCAHPEAQITILGFPANYSVWDGWNGDIVSGMFSFTPVTTMPGLHSTHVFNENTGCYFIISAFVEQANDYPIADPGNDQLLGCGASSLVLNGTGSSTWANLVYSWTTINGSILNGSSSLTPEVGGPGTYTLTVIDTLNNCQSSDLVIIYPNNNTGPTADAGTPQTLLCGQSSLQLSGVGSSTGAGFTYLWTTQNGNILNGDSTLAPTVNAPGLYTLTVIDTLNGCSAMDTVQIGQDANAPIADAGAPQSLTCSVLSVMLDGTGSSSGPGISYLWTTTDGIIFAGANTLTPTVTAAGTYLLTVTNTANNCQTLASVIVSNSAMPPIAIAAAPQPLTCTAQEVQLDGTGSSAGADISYQWSGPGIIAGDTTLLPMVNLEGTYTLVVTNVATGCTASSSLVLTQNTTPPLAVAAAPQSLDCLAQQVNLSGTGSSSGADFSYLWTGPGIVSGATTLSPLVDAPGDYTLTVISSNGCVASATISVQSNNNAPMANAFLSNNITCNQPALVSIVGSSGGPNISYSWDGPGISSISTDSSLIAASLPGIYTLTVTDNMNGCTATSSVTIILETSPPVVDAGPNAVLDCKTAQIELHGSTSANQSSQFWTFVPDPGVVGEGIVSGPFSFAPWVNLSGTYFLTVTDLATGCIGMDSVVVVADNTPPMVDAGPPMLIGCSNDTLELMGSTDIANGEFQWTLLTLGSFVGNTNEINVLVDEPGYYYLQVTNPENGCTAIDSVPINNALISDDFPHLQIDVSHCQNPFSSIQFTGGDSNLAPFMLSMDGGNSFFTIDTILENLPSGVYNFVLIDVNGCNYNEGVVFTAFPPFMVDMPAILNLNFGENGQLNPSLSIPISEVDSINWTPSEGLSCSDCLQPIASPSSDINYQLTITNMDGCTATASITVHVTQPPTSLYVPNAFSPNDDGINDFLTVFADEKLVKQIVSFQVFSRWGESVFEGFGLRPNDVTMGWDGSFRGKKVDSGVYAWFAEVELISGEKKIVKGDVTVVR